MENFRSKSTREGRMQVEISYGGENCGPTPSSMHDLRSYSSSHVYSYVQPPPPLGPPPSSYMGKEVVKMKKGKSSVGVTSKSWSFNDPELQRKKRVAGYKVYAVEGKLKGSIRKSFSWIKDTLHGWW